jgi:hypothetical protein
MARPKAPVRLDCRGPLSQHLRAGRPYAFGVAGWEASSFIGQATVAMDAGPLRML